MLLRVSGQQCAILNCEVKKELQGIGKMGSGIVTGYDYKSSINFKSVLIPKPLPGGQSKFELVVGKQTFPLEAGKRFFFTNDFPNGINAFTVRGIDVSEKLDPTNLAAFITGITLMKEGQADVKMVVSANLVQLADCKLVK